ncbi:hypothetical protein B0H13DRAFT_2018828 [Mycena leptocephala]|nr:hypothetical protein B0H13DRAFT_2018828 [Mycena leptocephala]
MATNPLQRRDRRLPQELIDAIVLEFHDDSSRLSACSETARIFRVPCQRRIFRELVLRSEESGYSHTYQKACNLLTSSPHLEAYVHVLTTAWPTESMEMQPLESVLRALHNVQRFTISNTGSRATWKTISPSLSSAISEILSLDSLDRLHLIGIGDVPFSFIYHAACTVRVLSLDISVDRNIATVPTQPSPSQPQLEHLILLHSRSTFHLIHFILILIREGYLRNTRRLFLPLEPRDVGYQALFDSLPATLQRLEIEYGLIRDIITPPKFGFLHVLELGFYIGESRVLPGNLDLIASRIPELTPVIKSLTVTLQVMPRIPEIPWELGGPWPVFDVGFMERGELPRLRNVTCCLHLKMDYFHGDSSVFYGRFVKAMEEKLTGLTGTDMLRFTQRNSTYRHEDHLP